MYGEIRLNGWNLDTSVTVRDTELKSSVDCLKTS